MDQNLSFPNSSSWVRQEIPGTLWARMFVTVLTTAHHWSYPKPDKSSSRPSILVRYIYFSIIFPSTPRASQRSVSFRLHHQNLCAFLLSPSTRAASSCLWFVSVYLQLFGLCNIFEGFIICLGVVICPTFCTVFHLVCISLQTNLLTRD